MADSHKYNNVTYRQIDLMKHTIGFRGDRVKGRLYHTFTPIRNYFDAGKADIPHFKQLVEYGLAEEYRENWFCITADGKEFLGYVLNVKILPEEE